MNHFRDNEFTIIGSPTSELSTEFDFPCLIECENKNDIFKMALEIHQTAARYVFLSLKDLEAGIENSTEAMNKLGKVTIFIEDISSLSLEQQKGLLDFLNQRESLTTPQLVIGTSKTYGQLKIDNKILPEFLRKITIGYLQLSQPFSAYKKENLLQFFFEGLAGRQRMLNETSGRDELTTTGTEVDFGRLDH